jgi:hypothetical protein
MATSPARLPTSSAPQMQSPTSSSRLRSPRSADPQVRRAFLGASCVPLTEEGSPTASLRSFTLAEAVDGSILDADETQEQPDDASDDFPDGDDGFGEFDEFEEGEEGEDDFGDFDDGFQGEEQEETSFDKAPDQPPVPAPSPGPVSRSNTIPCPLASSCCMPAK